MHKAFKTLETGNNNNDNYHNLHLVVIGFGLENINALGCKKHLQ